MGTWVAWICVRPGSELPTWLPKGIRPTRQISRLLIHSLNNINEKAPHVHLCSWCLSFTFQVPYACLHREQIQSPTRNAGSMDFPHQKNKVTVRGTLRTGPGGRVSVRCRSAHPGGRPAPTSRAAGRAKEHRRRRRTVRPTCQGGYRRPWWRARSEASSSAHSS